jgi:hypothetical protein
MRGSDQNSRQIGKRLLVSAFQPQLGESDRVNFRIENIADVLIEREHLREEFLHLIKRAKMLKPVKIQPKIALVPADVAIPTDPVLIVLPGARLPLIDPPIDSLHSKLHRQLE